MKYWELFREENEAMAERHELALERIRLMGGEHTVSEPYDAYFKKTADFILFMEETAVKQESGVLEQMTESELSAYTILSEYVPSAPTTLT